jgi:hypothetical protein
MLSKTILLLLLFTIISSNETPYQKALDKMKLIFGGKISNLPNYTKYVKDLKVNLDLLFTEDKNKVMQKCLGDSSCVEYLNNGNFSRVYNLYGTSFYRTLIGFNYTFIYTHNIDNKIFFLYTKGKIKENLIPQKKKVIMNKCKRVLLWTKCTKVPVEITSNLTTKELEVIAKAAYIKFHIEVLSQLNKLK